MYVCVSVGSIQWNRTCSTLAYPPSHTDLALMYRLFHRIADGIDPMAAMFREEVKREGELLVSDAEAQPEFDGDSLILKILAMQTKYLSMVKEEFDNSNVFHRALKEVSLFVLLCPLPSLTHPVSSSLQTMRVFLGVRGVCKC